MIDSDVEEFEKGKKEINRIQIKTKGNIGKFGNGEKEYFDLPFGWTKEVVYLKNQPSMQGKIRQDIYLIGPGKNGKKFQSDVKLQRFLQENPDIKCDLSVTSTKATVHREFLMNCSFGSQESSFSRKIHVENHIDDGDNILEDSDYEEDGDNILEDSGSDYEEEAKKEKVKRGIFVGSDSESEDESKKQKPETSKVSPIPKQIKQFQQQPKTYAGGKKGEKTEQKVR